MPDRRRPAYRCRALAGVALACVAANAQAASTLSWHCGKQRADVTIDARFGAERQQALGLWVRDSLDAVGQVYGAWPLDRIRVELRALGVASGLPWLQSMVHSTEALDAVPWGEVMRAERPGEPPTVLLVVNPRSDIDAIVADWVAYHELSHLLLPYRSGARWFVEGLATYYQNVAQARAGQLSERQMWQKLRDGFERGRNDNRWPKDKLWVVDEEVSRRHAYMRVYWTGTLYWLGLDVALRRAASGKQRSLDDALAGLRACCQGQRMHAWRIAERLDALTKKPWFTQRFDRIIESLGIPAYDPLLASIGVRADADGRVSLDDDAPHAALRADIAKLRFTDFRRRCDAG